MILHKSSATVAAKEDRVAHIDVFKTWAETIRQDIDAFKALLESNKADTKARKLAGGALQYLVSKMDLIPDYNPGIGVIDDVMVLRVCALLASDLERGALAGAAEASLERMANQSEKIGEFLGGPLYDKLKAYCAKLGDSAVRGRTPELGLGQARGAPRAGTAPAALLGAAPGGAGAGSPRRGVRGARAGRDPGVRGARRRDGRPAP